MRNEQDNTKIEQALELVQSILDNEIERLREKEEKTLSATVQANALERLHALEVIRKKLFSLQGAAYDFYLKHIFN